MSMLGLFKRLVGKGDAVPKKKVVKEGPPVSKFELVVGNGSWWRRLLDACK